MNDFVEALRFLAFVLPFIFEPPLCDSEPLLAMLPPLLVVVKCHSREIIPCLAVAYRLTYGGVFVENSVEVFIVEVIKFWILFHRELLDVAA